MTVDSETPYRLPAGLDLPDRHEWPVTLRYGPVVLRPLARADRRQWTTVRERSADWLAPWEPTAPPGCEPPKSSYAAVVRQLSRQARAGQALPWAVCFDPGLGPDAKAPVVGQLTVAGITLAAARHGSIGYWIDREHAGRGIIPTALALACDYLFAVARLHRVEICLCPDNQPSRRVVDKLGFTFEGVRESYLHIGGRWSDHAVYVLREDHLDEGLLVRLHRLGLLAAG